MPRFIPKQDDNKTRILKKPIQKIVLSQPKIEPIPTLNQFKNMTYSEQMKRMYGIGLSK